jgi:hypothetical protein
MLPAGGRVNDEIEKYAPVCIPCRWLGSRCAAQQATAVDFFQVMPLQRACRPCRPAGPAVSSATTTSTISESRRGTHPDGEMQCGNIPLQRTRLFR